MSKKPHFFVFLLFYLFFIPNIFSFPFYNTQSEQLINGNFLIIHQYGIAICDNELSRIIRTEKVFTDDDIITTDKMKNIIIKKFEDGYLICIINDKIYIFDNLGNFIYESAEINNNININFYTLTVTDCYHFYLGFITDDSLNVNYYEYNLLTNEISSIAESGDIKKSESSWFGWVTTDYTFQNSGISCQIMVDADKGEVLACFFIICLTSGDRKCYWQIEFLKVNNNAIIEHSAFSSIRYEIVSNIKYFKVDVNSEKNQAIICSYLNTGDSSIFFYNIQESVTSPHLYYLYDIYSYTEYCLDNISGFKVKYFSEKEQYIFSCLNSLEKIVFVELYFNESNNFGYNTKNFISNDECINYNGYNVFYSQEKDYFPVSDYLCEKIIDNTDNISEEEENENTENEEETKEETETEKALDEEYECPLEKCFKCNKNSESQNLCETCNESKNYYPLKESISENNNYIDCFNSASKPQNYFFNNIKKYFEPCYESCSKCEIEGDKINNNCIECDFGYIPIQGLGNTYNCIYKCPYYFYYTNYGQYKCTKLAICPDDYYLLIREKEQCIDDCTKDTDYTYQYNGECYIQCPENLSDNNGDHICVDNSINKCSLTKREIKVKNEKITDEEIDKLTKTYSKEFIYTDNHISFYNYNNYEIAIYKNHECISDLNLEIPSVNLGECYRDIQTKYVIEDNLIITVLAQRVKEVNYPILISFSIFSPYNGNKLNITNICSKEEVNVQEDISMKIPDKEKYNLVQTLSQQNIDVFNLSSDFYQDICYFFESPIKKDISLKDRVKLFFPNITLCENGCTIKGINATTMKADCECKISNLLNKNELAKSVFYKSQLGEIDDLLSNSNIEILKCTTKVFKHRSITSFVGAFIILGLILFQIVFTIIYFIVSRNPLINYVVNIIKKYLDNTTNIKNAPKKKKNVKFKNNTESKDKDNNNSNNKKPKRKYRTNKTEVIKDSNSKIKKNNINKKDATSINNSTIKIFHINNSHKDLNEISSSKKILKKHDIIKNNLIDDDSSKNKIPSKTDDVVNIDEYLETDLDDLSFDEVKIRDKRNFCEYFSGQIKSNLLIVNIFTNNDPFKPRMINIILFIINIDLYLFANALFINEDFISEVFYSNKDNFFSFLTRSIDRIFYTTIVKVIVDYIVDCFFIDEKKIKVILKSKRNSLTDKKSKINEILKNTLNRFIFFIVFSFVITLFSLYYIICFNYRYYYITNEWIKSSVFIILFIHILSILTILLESLLRFLSLKINSEKIYKLSLFFS